MQKHKIGNNIGNRTVLGPGKKNIKKWQEAGLKIPDTKKINKFRLERIVNELIKRKLDAVLLYDPMNIRYASDSTNMHLWMLHNTSRYVLVFANGKVVVFDYPGCQGICDHNNLITEIRPALTWFYFSSGDLFYDHAKKWCQSLCDTLIKYHGNTNLKLAVDKLNPEGYELLRARGIEIANGEQVMENARVIKCGDEIKAMRIAIHVAEIGVSKMHKHLKAGKSENQIWSHLHKANIANDGEWIECRLVSAGQRTNPWFQECSSNIIKDNDCFGFDTDMIGPYGMCADFSRSWLVGDKKPTPELKHCYELAIQQLQANTEILKPGISLRELSQNCLQYDPQKYHRYSLLYHGVGQCDEYPVVVFKDQWDEFGFDAVIEENMVLCVESYVGKVNGKVGVKIENQVLITKKGFKNLSNFPIALRL